MSAIPSFQKKYYSFQDYLRLEQEADLRYEYFDGEVFAMAGNSMNHADITSNINNLIRAEFRKRGCRSFQESIKVELVKDGAYVYPDVVLTCSQQDMEDGYLIRNPVLVVEVLSPSSEGMDRKKKWQLYRRLPTLKYYLLVSQDEPFAELYSRSQPNALFIYQAFDKMEETILLPDIDFTITMQQVYEGISFPPADNQ